MKIDALVQNRWKEVLNSEWYKRVFELYSQVQLNTAEFYSNKKMTPAMLPITTESISSPMGLGSDSVPVRINLMGQETYLADSMQFLLEYTLRMTEKKGTYYIMPTFRGEDSDERHLNQFFHSEVEILGGLEDIITLAEEYVKYLTNSILNTNILQKLKVSEEHIQEIKKTLNKKFPRVKFREAFNLLGNECPEGREIDADGLQYINKIGEQYLINKFDGVLWLTHFPHKTVPFYQGYSPENESEALNADLLIGMGETLGLGERVNRTTVKRSLDEHLVDEKEYSWYIGMKRDFDIQTSGFGMGVERYLAWLTNNHDVRDFPVVYREKMVKMEI